MNAQEAEALFNSFIQAGLESGPSQASESLSGSGLENSQSQSKNLNLKFSNFEDIVSKALAAVSIT